MWILQRSDKMKTQTKNIINLFGVMNLFWIFLISFVIPFIIAYLSPTKSVTIFIDNFGEANIELFLIMPAIFLSGLSVLIFQFNKFFRERK